MKPERHREILCLSIRQPWAWAITAGHKDVENRTRNTTYRGIFLIHSSSRFTRKDQMHCMTIEDKHGIEVPQGLLQGGIVGWATLVGSTTKSPSQWFCGPWGWRIGKAGMLPFIPLKGSLGFFRVPDDVYEQIVPQVGYERE